MGNQQAQPNDIFNVNNPDLEKQLQNEPYNTMLINSYTWSKDSHGLYDYEGENNIKKQQVRIQGTGKIYRSEEEIYFREEENKDKKNDQLLLNVYKSKSSRGNVYTICQNREQNLYQFDDLDDNEQINENSMWLIVRSLKQVKGNKHGCLLRENDYLKLGRVRFRVKEISKAGQQNQDNETESQSPNKKQSQNKSQNIKKTETQGTVPQEDLQNSDESIREEGKSCRFCLSDTYRRDNPLLTPCKCSGSVKHIHVKCLQTWLQSRIQTKSSSHSTAYLWKNLQCELCGHQYPHTFYENGKGYQAFEMAKPQSPYIIMEILDKDSNECKGIHVISMQNKNIIKIGRGSDSDMKVTDISVSRCHAFIKYIKGNFYLEDHNSKFGTLALIKNSIDLSQETNKIAIQVKRTVFYFYIKNQQKMNFCCAGKTGKKREFVLNPESQQSQPLKLKNKQSTQPLQIQEQIQEEIKEQQQQQNQQQQMNHDGQLPNEEEKQEDEGKIVMYKSSIKPNNLEVSNNLSLQNLQSNNNRNISQQQQKQQEEFKFDNESHNNSIQNFVKCENINIQIDNNNINNGNQDFNLMSKSANLYSNAFKSNHTFKDQQQEQQNQEEDQTEEVLVSDQIITIKKLQMHQNNLGERRDFASQQLN